MPQRLRLLYRLPYREEGGKHREQGGKQITSPHTSPSRVFCEGRAATSHANLVHVKWAPGLHFAPSRCLKPSSLETPAKVAT